MLTIRAKSDAGSELKGEAPCFELGLGEFGRTRFYPGNEWQQFVTSVTIPADTIPSPRVNAILRMPGKGTAWFDMIQVFEAKDINRSINPEFKHLWEFE
jgi:hypothetical protein